MIVYERARAKVNLTLRIRGRRRDGYHELVSLVGFAQDAADALTISFGDDVSVTSIGPYGGSIAGENLVSTTLSRLRQTEPGLVLGQVTLRKDLPIAAGLGGGSADAAAVLRAVRAANPKFVQSVDWQGVAAALGADVPVCFANATALMSGIGDVLEPVGEPASLVCVLVNPMVVVPDNKTAQVFGRLNAPFLDEADGLSRDPIVHPALDTLANVDTLLEFMADEGNDLERAASLVVPDIGEVLKALRDLPSCRLAAMSGAGPTCFGVFTSMDDACQTADVLARDRPTWWIRATGVGS